MRCMLHIYHWQGFSVLSRLVLVSFLLTSEVCNAGVVSVFHQQSGSLSPLQNFIFDPNSRSLFVSGINVVYKLSDNLREDAAVMLGPHQDIVQCASGYSLSLNCTLASVTSDTVNQALVLDTDSEVLIACGTLYGGSCAKINTGDFSTAEYIYCPVVPTDGSKSVAVVVAPGFGDSNLLYIGAAYSRPAVTLHDRVGLFSVRNLQTFKLASVETSTSSFIAMLPDYQDSFTIDFIRAYHFNGYVYFFFRRPTSLGSVERTSHVLRICTNDHRMFSIVELRLQCSVNDVTYPYLQDITLTDFTPPLQMQGDGTITGSTLVGVFTSTAEGSGNSAVCFYQMTGSSGVEVHFQTATENCFRGSGSKGPEYIVAPVQCIQVVSCY